MTDQKPLVWVLGTGGTVSSWGSPRLVFFDYGRSGERLGVSQILERVPEIDEYARIQTEQVTQAKSGNIGPSGWLRLSKRINEILRGSEDEASGVVLFHGTSSMEETAYWLNLTVRSSKPVVLTGAMRPPSALSTDADNNLLRAVILARSEEAREMGVMIMLNDEIHAAREVTKRNSYRLETFWHAGSGHAWIFGLGSQSSFLPYAKTPTYLSIGVRCEQAHGIAESGHYLRLRGCRRTVSARAHRCQGSRDCIGGNG